MANISKAERERRALEAATTPTTSPQEEIVNEPTPIVNPIQDDPDEEAQTIPAEAPAQTQAKSVFSPSDNDLAQIHAIALEKEKQLSRDAISQAIKDACAIATAKVNDDPVTMALSDDLGNKDKRQKFLNRFGPSNVKPPKPKPGPMGFKDEAVMRWVAAYEPDEFKATYGHSNSTLVRELLKTIN